MALSDEMRQEGERIRARYERDHAMFQISRAVRTLWAYYVLEEGATQAEVAEVLGVSQTIISRISRLSDTQIQELENMLEGATALADAALDRRGAGEGTA